MKTEKINAEICVKGVWKNGRVSVGKLNTNFVERMRPKDTDREKQNFKYYVSKDKDSNGDYMHIRVRAV